MLDGSSVDGGNRNRSLSNSLILGGVEAESHARGEIEPVVIATPVSSEEGSSTDSEIAHAPLHGLANARRRVRCEASAHVHEVAAWNNYQAIGHELDDTHVVELRGRRGGVLEIVLVEYSLDGCNIAGRLSFSSEQKKRSRTPGRRRTASRHSKGKKQDYRRLHSRCQVQRTP